jgi:hypothetical protein
VRSVTIEVPMMPPQEVSPNWYGPWRVRAKARAEFRDAAYYATRALPGAEQERLFFWYGRPVVMDVAVEWCCRRKRMDDDNLVAAMKAARDGIAACVFSGDDQYIRVGTVTQTRGGGTTTVTLREAECPDGDGDRDSDALSNTN